MTYKLTTLPSIVRLADGAFIPCDPANTDYAAYLQWLADGNTPQPVDVPTLAELKATVLREARDLRTKLFSMVDGLQVSALATGNAADATAIETFKVGARNITKLDLSVCTTEQAMRDAINNQYKAIVAPAPVSVKLAFAQALQ